MSAPQTGRISIPRPRLGASVHGGSLRLVRTLGLAAVRTPEITIGALGVLVAAAFSWVPSLWYDEAATVSSATRSWAQLWAELHHVDAVHGLYYALMHCWFWLVGYTPFTLRFPSALAVGVAAAIVVALGRRIGGRRLGVVAGVVFILLPRVEWAGTEGRPYATITALSAALTLVGLTAVRRTRSGGGRTWWAAYAVLAVLAATLNLYLSLVVVAHGVALAWTLLAERRTAGDGAMAVRGAAPAPLVTRHTALRWAIAAVVAAAVIAPFAREVSRQSGQLSWIGPVDITTVDKVFSTAWFGHSIVFAAVAWSLMVTGVVVVLRRRRAGSPPSRDAVRAQAVRVALPIVVVPTALLVAVSAAGEHLYSPKYSTMSLPFVAILVALGLTAIRPRALLATAVVALVVVSVPTTIAVKLPHAKQDSYWSDAATIVQQQRALRPAADEGVVYGSVYGHPATTSQVIADAYPTAFEGMTDLAATTNGAARGVLWNTNGDVRTTVPARLGGIDTVWFVGGTSRNEEPKVASTLAQQGFVVAGYWTTGTVIVTQFTR